MKAHLRVVAHLVVWGVLCLQGARCSQAQSPDLDALLSADHNDRAMAFIRIKESREATIERLLSVVRSGDGDVRYGGSLHLAIVVLGELRASRAVGVLAEKLLFVPDEFVLTERISSQRYFVAAVALVEIGVPAVDEMVAVLRNDRDEQKRKLAAWVLLEVLGEREAVARLEERMRPGAFGQERFEEAIAYIVDYEPVFEHPHAIVRPKPGGGVP